MKKILLFGIVAAFAMVVGSAEAQRPSLRGSTGTPTCSGCGSSANSGVVGGDQAFKATLGSNGVGPTLTFTFSATQPSKPACIASLEHNGVQGYYLQAVYSSTTTVIVKLSPAGAVFDQVNVFCPRVN